jgi:predicted transcriptional regulator
MARVTFSVSDEMLRRVDEDANKRGVSRSQIVAESLDSINRIHNLELELNKEQTEVMKLNRQTSAQSNQIAENDKKLESMTVANLKSDEQVKRLEVEILTKDLEIKKLNDALELNHEEIAFLRGHVSLLTQSISQLSLKPGEEEIKKKGWWQFWR